MEQYNIPDIQSSPKKGGTAKKECKPNQIRGESGRCIRECVEGETRNTKTNKCIKNKTARKQKTRNTSLTSSQRADFDNMLHIMRQPVGKRNKSRNSVRTPIDIKACITTATDDMLKDEITRRGYKINAPVINQLIPRKKGEPRT